MKKIITLFIILYALFIIQCKAQNKSGYTWLVGNNASYGKFDGSNNRPITGSFYNPTFPYYAYAFTSGSSNICDSATGNVFLLCNGMQLFDTMGNFIENGDSLVPVKMYTHNSKPSAPFSQGCLILPKGNAGQYYVIIPTVTDSGYNTYWTNQTGIKYPYDELLVHTVDMNANGGMGKVIEKNRVILKNVDLALTMMQACRHSNGVDWWVLKHGLDTNSNKVYRFLFTKDSIYGPFLQTFNTPNCGYNESTGQNCFSSDGTKYAFVRGQCNKLFVSDFDRCTGELNNPKVLTIPIDSVGYQPIDSTGKRDSINSGVCFSPNGQYLYISKWANIYQLEMNEPDSSLAWYNVKRGPDTTWSKFEYYHSLKLGIDNRIYIGKWGGGFKQFSVIDSPDNKGSACGFCRKCFRVDNAYGGLNTPPNIPDFNLGADLSKPCWPLSSVQLAISNEQLEVFPNPSSTIFEVRGSMKGSIKELYNSIGQMILSTKENEIDVSRLPKGLYYLKVGNETKKVIVE